MAGGLAPDQLGSLVSIDASLRWFAASGEDTEAVVAPFFGSLAMQHAAERELAKEGFDRETLGPEGFGARVRTFEEAWRAEAASSLERLGVSFAGMVLRAATDAPEVVDAARVAFVRLYDAGLLELADRVVDVCPRCATVVHAADAERTTIAGEALTLRLAMADGDAGHVDVQVQRPELIPGAVAVAVPAGHPVDGGFVVLPIVGRAIPVVADLETETPMLVIAAHDRRGHEIARRAGLVPIEVLAADGTVQSPAALAGLPQFGARVQVTALLDAEGVVVAREPIDDTVSQCRGCGTVLVPRLGRHWFLHTAEIEFAAADAVRQGALRFSPPAARQDFINWAGYSRDWCLSHQVWGGHAIPVAVCTDCGEVAVALDPPRACRKCLAEVVPDTAVFDARFLGVMWALATAGWPAPRAPVAETGVRTSLAVRPAGLFTWAVPMAALGLWLAKAMPFSTVVVHEATPGPDDAALAEESVAAARLAVLAGDGDLERGRALAAAIDSTLSGAAALDALEAEMAVACADLRPAAVLPALSTVLREGIDPTERFRLGRITAALIGDAGEEGDGNGLR